MDQTGNMTPPHFDDPDTREFAPVIPLRRRPHDADSAGATQSLEAERPGIWDLDAPFTGLTQRASVRDGHATEPPKFALASADGTAEHGESSGPRPQARAGSRRLVRRRRAQIAAACALLAGSAAVLALRSSEGSSHATRAATVTLPSALEHHTIAERTTSSQATTHRERHAHHLALKRVAISRPTRKPKHPATQHSRETTNRRPAVVTTMKTPRPVVVSAPAPTGPRPATTTTPGHNQTASVPHDAGPPRTAVSACVPGELGC